MTWFEVLKSLTPTNMDDILDDLEDVMGFYKGGSYVYWTPEIDRLHNELEDLLDIAGPTTKEVLAKYDSVISKILDRVQVIYNTDKSRIEEHYDLEDFNDMLNELSSKMMTADFRYKPKRRSAGYYSPDDDAVVVNLATKLFPFGREYYYEQQEKIYDTLTHEFGHQASKLLDYPYKDKSAGISEGNNLMEEYIAYTVQMPDNPNGRLLAVLRHPQVKRKARRNPATMKMYNKIKEKLMTEEPYLLQEYGRDIL